MKFTLPNRERSGSPYYYPVVDDNERAERLNAMLDDFRKLGICLKQRTASGINSSEDPSNCLRNLLDNSVGLKKLLSYIQTDKEPNEKFEWLREQLGVELDAIVDNLCHGYMGSTYCFDRLFDDTEFIRGSLVSLDIIAEMENSEFPDVRSPLLPLLKFIQSDRSAGNDNSYVCCLLSQILKRNNGKFDCSTDRGVECLQQNWAVIRELNTKLESSNICSKINIESFCLDCLESSDFQSLLLMLDEDIQDRLDVTGVVSLLNKLVPTDPNWNDNIKKIKKIYENSKFLNEKLHDLFSSKAVNIANFDFAKIEFGQIDSVLPPSDSFIWHYICMHGNLQLPGADEMFFNYIDKFNSGSNFNNDPPVLSFSDSSFFCERSSVLAAVARLNERIRYIPVSFPVSFTVAPAEGRMPIINVAKWDLIKYPLSTIDKNGFLSSLDDVLLDKSLFVMHFGRPLSGSISTYCDLLKKILDLINEGKFDSLSTDLTSLKTYYNTIIYLL